MKVGDWVRVIARSKKYNAHINNLGYVGQVDMIVQDAVQITCINGGAGAVDMDCLVVIAKPTASEIKTYGYDRY